VLAVDGKTVRGSAGQKVQAVADEEAGDEAQVNSEST
jgi:hypothetical protein